MPWFLISVEIDRPAIDSVRGFTAFHSGSTRPLRMMYGSWDYPACPPAPGWVVGGAIASGIAWGAGFAIGNAIWDNFDWRHGNINVDIDKNVNINKHVNRNNVKTGNWEHNPQHRKGVSYNNKQVQNKFGKDAVKSADRKLDYRGRSGEQRLARGGSNRVGMRDNPRSRTPPPARNMARRPFPAKWAR